MRFAASSVSKIAKEAGVSPATIYVYHKNKEDLLVSTYIEIKKNMGLAMIEQNIIKNVDLNKTHVETAFTMAWDEIKL
ncbi:MAG: TetR/AcrR family transcriptional regulator; helix-turn-helix transcriptional regulator [Proteobacteria bacterium]|nr:TetR/AcrR family transcriptional regulator; helix-turn-helix transcriptional regulator [Pseudomonadota bacterium]